MIHRPALALVLLAAVAAAQRPTTHPTSRPTKPAIAREGEAPLIKERTKPERAWGIVWQPTLAAAVEKAGDKRPVAWFRILGDLTGYS